MVGNRVWLETANKAVVVRKQYLAPSVCSDGLVRHPATRHKLETDWLRATDRLPTVNLVTANATSLVVTTEFASSRTLAHPSLTPSQTIDAVILVCKALHQLHRHGLIHGAIKSEHVLTGSKRIWLCGTTGLGSDPSVDATGFNTMLQDLAYLQFSAPCERSGSSRWRECTGRRQSRKLEEQWSSALTVIGRNYSHRLPNPSQLAQLFSR